MSPINLWFSFFSFWKKLIILLLLGINESYQFMDFLSFWKKLILLLLLGINDPNWIICNRIICYFSLFQGSHISGVPMPSERHPEALCCENAEKNSKCSETFLSTFLCSTSYSQGVFGQDLPPAAKILKTSLLLSFLYISLRNDG